MEATTDPSQTDPAPTLQLATVQSQNSAAISLQLPLEIIYYVIGTAGVLGNLGTVVIISMTMDTGKVLTNMLILLQSCIDLICSIFLILTTATPPPQRVFSSLADILYCKIWLTKMPLWICFMSSSLGLVVITVERFIAIKFPIWHKTSMTRTKLLTGAGLLLLAGNVTMVTYCVASTPVVDGKCNVYQIGNPSHAGTMLIVFQYYLPILVFIVVYGQMASLLRSRVGSTTHDGPSQGKLSRNILLTLLKVVLCFVVCWSPNQIYFVLYQSKLVTMPLDSIFYNTTVVLVFCNCCCNPVVYALSYKRFRLGAKKLLCGVKNVQHSTSNQSTANEAS